MTSAAESPDIRQLQGESLPTGDFPVGGKQDFRVFFTPAVHAQIWKHAGENLALEICGVLVGTWQRDAVGPFVTIAEFIRCDAAKSGFAEVTFTHDAWTKINAEMDTRLSAFKIVGWYHSHPDFGIFLSDRDVFIHQHFFSGAGQIAHVVDPVRKIEGVFAWQQGKPVLRPHFWVGERVLVTPERATVEEPPGIVQAEPIPGPVSTARGWSAWMQAIITAAMFVCVFMLGFLLALRLIEWDRERERQRDLMGVVLYFAEHQILRPGLEDRLARVGGGLSRILPEMDRLADGHVKLAGEEKETVKEKWGNVRDGLAAIASDLDRIRKSYSLTPAEQDAVRQVVLRVLQPEERELQSQGRTASDKDEPGPGGEKPEGGDRRLQDNMSERPRKVPNSSSENPGGDSSKASRTSTPSRE